MTLQHSGRNMWSGGYCTVAETCGREGTAQWPKHVVWRALNSGRSGGYCRVAETCSLEGTEQWPVGRVLNSRLNMWSGGDCTMADREGTAQWPKHVVDINISNIIYLMVINQSLKLEAFPTLFIDGHSSAQLAKCTSHLSQSEYCPDASNPTNLTQITNEGKCKVVLVFSTAP